MPGTPPLRCPTYGRCSQSGVLRCISVAERVHASCPAVERRDLHGEAVGVVPVVVVPLREEVAAGEVERLVAERAEHILRPARDAVVAEGLGGYVAEGELQIRSPVVEHDELAARVGLPVEAPHGTAQEVRPVGRHDEAAHEWRGSGGVRLGRRGVHSIRIAPATRAEAFGFAAFRQRRDVAPLSGR